jgi:glycosyltransferase involved in cell wall biosynthesis
MRRLRVLQLASHAPYPLDQGGRIRSFHLLRALQEIADVGLVCFQHEPGEQQGADALADLGFDVVSVPVPSFQACWRHHVRSVHPLLAQRYGLTTLLGPANAWVARTPHDVVVVDGPDALLASVGIERTKGPRLIYHAHNVESQVYRRCLALERRSLKSRLVGELDLRKMERFERHRMRRFAGITATSAGDARTLQRWAPAATVYLIPNGTDCSRFVPPESDPEPGAIVFMGTLSYAPNRDAVVYFAERIFPRIKRAVPWATWYVVGRESDDVRRALSRAPQSGIVVTGYVDDVRPYLARAEVVAVPLRAGGGTRLKILEAMAMARPVVSTSLGAEGLDLMADRHLSVADTPDGFADAVIRLLRDPAEGRRLGREARRAVLDRYDWGPIARRYVDAVLEIVGVSRQRGAA